MKKLKWNWPMGETYLDECIYVKDLSGDREHYSRGLALPEDAIESDC